MGYLVSPYPYPNGAGGPIPVSMVSVYHFIVSRIVLPVRRKELKDESTRDFETFPLAGIFIPNDWDFFENSLAFI